MCSLNYNIVICFGLDDFNRMFAAISISPNETLGKTSGKSCELLRRVLFIMMAIQEDKFKTLICESS